MSYAKRDNLDEVNDAARQRVRGLESPTVLKFPVFQTTNGQKPKAKVKKETRHKYISFIREPAKLKICSFVLLSKQNIHKLKTAPLRQNFLPIEGEIKRGSDYVNQNQSNREKRGL